MRWVRNSKCYIRYYNRRWWYILIWGLYSISGSFCRKNDSHRIFFEESFGHKGRNVGHCPIDRLGLLPWRERGRTQNGTKNFRHRIFPLSVECKRKIIKRVFSSNKFFSHENDAFAYFASKRFENLVKAEFLPVGTEAAILSCAEYYEVLTSFAAWWRLHHASLTTGTAGSKFRGKLKKLTLDREFPSIRW